MLRSWTAVSLLLVAGASAEVIAFTDKSAALLNSPGGALIAAGLAIVVSRVTSRETSFEQYRKDAILKYKDDLYVPLHTELRTLLNRLEAARSKQAPFPQSITLAGASSGFDPLFPSVDPTATSLDSWVQFRADFRAERFSKYARGLLDATISAAEQYNTSLEAVRPAAVDHLGKTLNAAIERVRRSRDFELWKRNPAYIHPASDLAGHLSNTGQHWFSVIDEWQVPEEQGTTTQPQGS